MSTRPRRALLAVAVPLLAFGLAAAAPPSRPLGGDISSQASQIFHVGDPATGSPSTSDILVACLGGDILTPAVTIRIPQALIDAGLRFDTNAPAPSVSVAGSLPASMGKVSSLSYSLNSSTFIQINLSSSFTAGVDFIRLTNIRYEGSFGVASGVLQFDKNNNVTIDGLDETDDKTLTIVGNGTLTMAGPDQIFRTNETTAAGQTLTLTDHATAPGFLIDTDIRIRIPLSLNVTFDTNDTAVTVNNAKVSPTVSFEGNRVMVLNVTSNFLPAIGGESVNVSGFTYTNIGATGPEFFLELEVNNLGGFAVDTSSPFGLRVAGLPTLNSGAFQSFTRNDPFTVSTSNANQINIFDASDVAMINATGGLRLRISDSLNMVWDTTVNSVTARNNLNAQHGKVTGAGVTYGGTGSNKIAIIPVQSTFAISEELRLTGLRFSTFGAPSGSFPLTLDVNNNGVTDATDTFSKAVGQPTISYAATSYNEGEEATPIPTITVKDHATVARIRADDTTGDIRIIIPAGLNMIWDTTDTTASLVFAGGGSGTVSTTVIFEDLKTCKLDVTADFTVNREVQISGLNFTSFNPSSVNLQLEVNNANTVCHTAVNAITIGGKASITSPAQSFTFNDPSTVSTSNATTFRIVDAATVPQIKAAQGIRIVIPAGLNMTWDTTVTTVTALTDALGAHPRVTGAGVTYPAPDPRKTVIIPCSDFTTLDGAVNISGLRFANFTSGSGFLGLELDGDGATEDDDANAKAIGLPTLSYAATGYNQGEEATAAPVITILDDASNPRIRDTLATGDIRLRIPVGLNMIWDTTVTTVGVNFLTGSGNINGANLLYEDAEKTVRLDVTSPFTAGTSVQITGLRFTNFTSGAGGLQLEVNNADTVCFNSLTQLTIGGRPTISSGAAQSFTFNDPSTVSTSNATTIRVVDAATVPMIKAAQGIRIIIPAGLNMSWDTTVTTVTAQTDALGVHPRVTGAGVTYPGPDPRKTVVIPCTDFTTLDGAVNISGLRFGSFVSGSGLLELEVDGDPAVEAAVLAGAEKRIGQPNIATAGADYNEGEEETGGPTITVTDDGSVNRIRAVDGTGDIRVIIPSGLNMIWDTTAPVSAVASGGTSGTVGAVSYESGEKVMIINVLTDFVGARQVAITNYRFKNFTQSGIPTGLGLELEVNNANTSCRTTTGLFRIGGRPSISSVGSQTFIVGDAPTTVLDVTVTDAAGVAMITTGGDIRIKLPAGFGATWDTAITAIGAGGHAKINTTATYEPGGPNPTTAVINVVNNPFSPGESVTISGLRLKGFTAASTGSLTLEVDGDTDPEATDGKSLIIGAPTITLLSSPIYTKGDPAIATPRITVTENGAGACVKAAREIRVIIPSGLALVWDTTFTTAAFGGLAFTSGRVPNSTVVFESNKIVRVEVAADLLAGDVLTIDNLRFTSFSASSSGLGLQLEVDLDSDAEATTPQQPAIGAPTISSVANQSFNVADPSTAASPITIQDDGTTPRILDAGNIRIRIPAGLGMAWDTAFNTISAQTGIGTTVTFEPGATATPSVVVINVTPSNFTINQSVTITGLQLHNFTESSASKLELVVNSSALTTCNVDDKTKQVGGQVTLSSAVQTFTVNDPATAAAQFVIQDAPGSAKIKDATNLRIKIPAGVNMIWDTTVTTITALTAADAPHPKVSPTLILPYENGDKTVVIQVSADFSPDEVVKLSGLRFTSFSAASSPLGLTLELDADPDAEAVDGGTKGIGAPTLVSAANDVFPVGPGPLPAASFTITNDATVPRIFVGPAGGDLRVRIPAGLNMIWDTLDTTASVTMVGAGTLGAVDSVVSYDGTGKILIIDVTTAFDAGRGVQVSGLGFRTFSAPSTPAFLELETNNAGTVADLDSQSKAIQGAPLLSSSTQTFSRNDPSTLVLPITVTDAAGVGSITTSGNIRIKIPAGLSMTWDTTITTIGTGGHLKVSTTLILPYEDGGKTAVIDVVNSDFSPGESVAISGLRFANFSAASPAALPLTLELDGDGAAEATDGATKGIGAPSLASSAVQVFQVGPGPVAAASFTITDDPNIARVRSDDATGDLRVRIPAGLDMAWDTSDTTATVLMGGAGTLGAVSTTVSYDNDKTLVLNVTTSFDPGRSVQIGGLSFRFFNSPSVPDLLELEVNNQDTVVGSDSLTKAIQGTPTIASAAQEFTRNDPSTLAAAITVTDAGGVPTITQATDLRITIPAGLNMTWDTTVTSVGTGGHAKVSTTLLPYEAAGRTAVINVVNNDFLQAENVVLSGLRFANFDSGSGTLGLEISGGGAPEAVTAALKRIGAPTILSAANQGFNVGDPTTSISPITITEDGATPRVRADDVTGDIRITIPSGFNMIWDTADTTATVMIAGAGGGAASNLVSYEDGGRTLRIDVTSDFGINQTLQLSDVSFRDFNGTSPVDNLELELNNAGTVCDLDNATILIGGLPTISSAANQTFGVGDPETAIATITLTDAAGNGMFRQSREIRIVIPNAFPMVWNTDDPLASVTPGAGTGTASTTVSYPNDKTLQIDITADFSAGQTLTVSGLSFRNFQAAAVGGQLGLDVDLDPAMEATDDKTLAIGAPALSSDASQSFVVGDPPTAISRVTIMDGTTSRITALNDLRIRIPDSLAMTFDTSDVTPVFGGLAAGKVAATVSYQNAGKILVIDVQGDFGAGETLTIEGLSFMNFTAASSPLRLELEVNNQGTVAAVDDKTKGIGGLASLSSSASQVFTAGDPPTSAGTITVTDAPAVAAIKDVSNIRIKIPDATPMVWDTTAAPLLTPGGGSGTVTVVSYEDGLKTLVIEVTNDFSPSQTLTITNHRFAGFNGSSLPAPLTLELDFDGVPEATDDKTKAVGAPLLASAADQRFGKDDPPMLISPFTITEDLLTPRIVADDVAGDLRVRVPVGFGMVWDTTDTTATIAGTASAKVSPIVSYEDAGRVLVLNVIADFAAGETVVVSDLSFDPSVLSTPANLELEVNNAADAVADLDLRSIRVGTRPKITGAVTADNNGNGSIDRITVTFDEDIDGASPGVLNASGVTLAGFAIPFGQKTAPFTVVYFLPESGFPNTGATPDLSYDPTVSELRDVDEGLDAEAYGPIPVVDGAPPRIVGVSYEDTDSDGFINTITFTLSEAVDLAQEDVGDWAILDGNGTTDLLAGLTDSDLLITGNQIVFTLADTTGSTTLPRYRYQSDGDGVSMRDLTGLLLPDQSNNAKPVADAGDDRTYAPTRVSLDGSRSRDTDGQPLQFTWTQTGGVAVTLTGPDTVAPTFVARVAGVYEFEVLVEDGLTSAVDTVSITIQNVVPTADAGLDRTVFAGDPVVLDGAASLDTNGDALTFLWTQVGGATVTLNNASTAGPDFTAPAGAGVLVFELEVTDTAANVSRDTVTVRVNVSGGNGVPTADAGGNRVGVIGVPLTLDGRRSVDPEGDDLTYLWSPAALLSSPAGATVTFTPTAPGNYTFTLVVTDTGGASSAPDVARVVVLPAGASNHPPLASAAIQPGDTVDVETSVTFDGSASADPEGQSLHFTWIQVGGPKAALSDSSSPQPKFIPVMPGTYVFELTVSDGTLASFPQRVALRVTDTSGTAPDADAALDPADADGRVTFTGPPLGLTAAGSTGTGLTFGWTQLEGPAVPIAGFDTATPSFTPTAAGTYVFLLVARDADGLVDIAAVSVVVDTAGNEAPTASAGPDLAGSAGATATLVGSASADPGGDADGVTGFGSGLLAFWRQVSGPAAALSDPGAAALQVLPTTAGTYVFELVVSDGDALSAGDRAVLTVTGTVVAGGGSSSGGGGCGLTGWDALLLLGLAAWGRRRLRS